MSSVVSLLQLHCWLPTINILNARGYSQTGKTNKDNAIWTGCESSAVRHDSCARLDKSNTENVMTVNTEKLDQFWGGESKSPGFSHFVWGHLITYSHGDAKAPCQHLHAALTQQLMRCLQQWKEEVAREVRDRLILLSTAHLWSQLSPAFQRMDSEHQTITWRHFMTTFKCKRFLLRLHLTQTRTNNLEVTSYYILSSNPSDSASFLLPPLLTDAAIHLWRYLFSSAAL